MTDSITADNIDYCAEMAIQLRDVLEAQTNPIAAYTPTEEEWPFIRHAYEKLDDQIIEILRLGEVLGQRIKERNTL